MLDLSTSHAKRILGADATLAKRRSEALLALAEAERKCSEELAAARAEYNEECLAASAEHAGQLNSRQQAYEALLTEAEAKLHGEGPSGDASKSELPPASQLEPSTKLEFAT